jgi:hypothetical protein
MLQLMVQNQVSGMMGGGHSSAGGMGQVSSRLDLSDHAADSLLHQRSWALLPSSCKTSEMGEGCLQYTLCSRYCGRKASFVFSRHLPPIWMAIPKARLEKLLQTVVLENQGSIVFSLAEPVGLRSLRDGQSCMARLWQTQSRPIRRCCSANRSQPIDPL